MSLTIVEKYPVNKKTKMSIKPYFNPSVDNMGLQKYGLSLFEGAFHEEQLACLEMNGIKRYITGLNEFAPEIKMLPEEERQAKIRQIRIIVSELEKTLNANVVDPSDDQFWTKIKLLRPDNSELWDRIKIRCSNDPVHLDPTEDPYDLIKLYAIEAGGFSMIAKSLDDARKMAQPPKFYLDKLEETMATNTEVSKLRNKAGGELEKLFAKNQNKLFYVAKILDPNSAQYKKSTPADVLYNNMDKYINGELTDRDKRKTAARFLEACELSMEDLKLKTLVKDGDYYKMIASKSDGFIYELQSNTMMGRTQADCVEFLKNPLNEDVLKSLTVRIEKYWNA